MIVNNNGNYNFKGIIDNYDFSHNRAAQIVVYKWTELKMGSLFSFGTLILCECRYRADCLSMQQIKIDNDFAQFFLNKITLQSYILNIFFFFYHCFKSNHCISTVLKHNSSGLLLVTDVWLLLLIVTFFWTISQQILCKHHRSQICRRHGSVAFI